MNYFNYFDGNFTPDSKYTVNTSFFDDQEGKGYCPECGAAIIKSYWKERTWLGKKRHYKVCKNGHKVSHKSVERYSEAYRYRIERNEIMKLLYRYPELTMSYRKEAIIQCIKGLLDKLDEYAGIVQNNKKQSQIEAIESILKDLTNEK